MYDAWDFGFTEHQTTLEKTNIHDDRIGNWNRVWPVTGRTFDYVPTLHGERGTPARTVVYVGERKTSQCLFVVIIYIIIKLTKTNE